MSGVMRSSLKFYPSSGFMNLFRRTIKPENAQQRLYSTLWSTFPKSASKSNIAFRSTAVWNKCNVSPKQYSTKSENELAEFLEQEISAEQKLQKQKTIPSKIDDFDVKLNGSEVTLVKSIPGETITLSFNINDSVDAYDPNGDELNEEERIHEILSKPEFTIAIKRGDTTLEFTCNYSADEVGPDGDEGEMSGDVFVIDEVSSYKGERKETNYRVSGGILDGYLYDLLMNYLDEKGITNEFVFNVSQLSTAYEHSSYISLLRDLKSFTSK